MMSGKWLTHLEHQWRSLAWRPWLEAFSREHTVVRYDSRGCGLSDRAVVTSPSRRGYAISNAWSTLPASSDSRCSDLPGRADRHGVRSPPSRAGKPLVLYGTYVRGRFKRTNLPNQVEKARVLLDLTRLGWGRRTMPSCRSGPRNSSRAGRSSICVPGRISSARPPPPRMPLACCRSLAPRHDGDRRGASPCPVLVRTRSATPSCRSKRRACSPA